MNAAATALQRETRPAPSRTTDRAKGRVLVVGPLPPPVHGCSVFTELLLESAVADEFDLLHLDITDRRDVDNIGRLDVGNVLLAARHGAQFSARLVTARPDLLYIPVAQNTWGFLRDALFLAPAALRRGRFVVHFHGDGFAEFRERSHPAVRALADACLARCAAAIVQGEALVRTVEDVIPRARIHVVPNGIPDRFPQRPVRTSARPNILFLSNLAPAKGYFDLIEASLRLLRSGVQVDVIFAGGISDFTAHSRAQALCAEFPDRFHFHGVADTHGKHELLSATDMLVLPSHSEAHPLVLLEAMSAWLPVVSTRRGAIPETVVDGETGLLVEPRDVDGLTDALLRLATDRDLRVRMGDAGRVRYCERFTKQRWADGMVRVFRAVLDNV